MYFKKNWGSLAEKDPQIGRVYNSVHNRLSGYSAMRVIVKNMYGGVVRIYFSLHYYSHKSIYF